MREIIAILFAVVAILWPSAFVVTIAIYNLSLYLKCKTNGTTAI